MHCCFGHEFVQSEQDLWSSCRQSSNKDLLLWSSSPWKTASLENPPRAQRVNQEKTFTAHVGTGNKTHLQQKALMLQYFFIPKMYFKPCLQIPVFDISWNSCFCMIYTPLFIYGTVFFLLVGWMLYCTVCRTILMKLQCLTWIIPLPYWEVFCVCCNVCNVFIVLWPIGVVAQNKAWFCIPTHNVTDCVLKMKNAITSEISNIM